MAMCRHLLENMADSQAERRVRHRPPVADNAPRDPLLDHFHRYDHIDALAQHSHDSPKPRNDSSTGTDPFLLGALIFSTLRIASTSDSQAVT